MSPLLPIGVGTSLAGGLLSGIGESRGLKAMAGESDRQGQEWASENQNQQQSIAEEIARRKMALQNDSVAPALAQRQGALAGAGTLATGLGMNSADRMKVQSALMPQMISGAYGDAQHQQGVQSQMGAGRMGVNMQQSQLNQRDRAKMYDQLVQQAGRSGQGFRQVGELMQQVGGIGANFGMMTPNAGPTASGPAENVPGQPLNYLAAYGSP